jgi:hypothetical protein
MNNGPLTFSIIDIHDVKKALTLKTTASYPMCERKKEASESEEIRNFVSLHTSTL